MAPSPTTIFGGKIADSSALDTLEQEGLRVFRLRQNPTPLPESHLGQVLLAIWAHGAGFYDAFIRQLPHPALPGIHLARALIEADVMARWLALDVDHITLWLGEHASLKNAMGARYAGVYPGWDTLAESKGHRQRVELVKAAEELSERRTFGWKIERRPWGIAFLPSIKQRMEMVGHDQTFYDFVYGDMSAISHAAADTLRSVVQALGGFEIDLGKLADNELARVLALDAYLTLCEVTLEELREPAVDDVRSLRAELLTLAQD